MFVSANSNANSTPQNTASIQSNQAETYRERDPKMKHAIRTAQTAFAGSAFALLMQAVAVVAPTGAHAQEACSVYTVTDGDTLAEIAQSAYGTFDYQTIFNANRSIIDNPNRIEPGTVFLLPCADGSLPNSASAQEIIEEQEAIQAARPRTSNAYEPPIRIVSGNGWAPFVGENFTGGGMLVRLATTALNRGGNARENSVSFVDDWASHADTLLPLGAFDISIAWYMPDCTKIDLLSDSMKRRCRAASSTPNSSACWPCLARLP